MKFQITVATLATILSASALTGQEPLQDRKPPVLQNAEQNAPKDQLLSKEQIFAKCLSLPMQFLLGNKNRGSADSESKHRDNSC